MYPKATASSLYPISAYEVSGTLYFWMGGWVMGPGVGDGELGGDLY